MWSWIQSELMVSCQSPGIRVMPPLPSGAPALGSVAAVLMVLMPASTIG